MLLACVKPQFKNALVNADLWGMAPSDADGEPMGMIMADAGYWGGKKINAS